MYRTISNSTQQLITKTPSHNAYIKMFGVQHYDFLETLDTTSHLHINVGFALKCVQSAYKITIQANNQVDDKTLF